MIHRGFILISLAFSLALTVVALLASGSASAATADPTVPPGVEELEPNDPAYIQHSEMYGQNNAPALWAAEQGKNCDVKVVVFDSWAAPIPDLPYVTRGGNYADGTGDDPHGTWVPSIIDAAVNNQIGVPGMVPCQVISVRVVPNLTSDGLPAALEDYCGQPGVRVVNLSLGTGGPYPAEDTALRDCVARGVLPVLAAGNATGCGAGGVGSSDPSANWLAANNSETIRAAGVNSDGSINICSDYGPALSDIGAQWAFPCDYPDGGWGICDGTSVAAPQVSAVAAWMFNINPGLSPAEVKQEIECSGQPVPGLNVGSGACAGRQLDALAAIEAAGYVPPPPAHVSVTRTAGGSISDDKGVLSCSGKTCSGTYVPKGILTLDATHDQGYVFAGWHGACSGHRQTCTVALSPGANITVKAAFSRVTVQIVVKTSGTGHGKVSVSGCLAGLRCRAAVGSTSTLRAVPDRRSKFVEWWGACKSSMPVCRLKITRNVEVTAVFAKR